MSLVKVVFNGAQAKNGATIAGYYAEIVGASNSVSTNGGTFREISVNKDTQMTLRGRVQDSRGIWSDWKEVKITFLFYFSPTLKFEVVRSGSKSDTLTIKRFAKIAPLSVNGVQKNTMKLTFTTAKVGTSNVVADNGQAGGEWSSISEFKASNANLGKEYPADTSFIVTGKLEDRFSDSKFQDTVPTDKVIMSYDQQGVGIGKYRENGALDVNGLIYSGSKPIQHHRLTEPNGAAMDNKVDNLNDYRTTGFYSILGNYKNHPASGEDACLEVVESISGYHQTLTTVSGRMFKRTVTSNSNGSWIEYTPKPDKPEPQMIKREVDIGWGIKLSMARKGSIVTASIIRTDSEIGVYEYGIILDGSIPDGFKPNIEVHLVANKNAGTAHTGVAVWHFTPDGKVRLTNPSKDRAIYTGTVTYLTEDN
jgi:minor structural protein